MLHVLNAVKISKNAQFVDSRLMILSGFIKIEPIKLKKINKNAQLKHHFNRQCLLTGYN
jgi:hypothetical protein